MADEGSPHILALIAVAEERLGFDALSGGNCGMFALALAQALTAEGIACGLAFLTERIEGDNLEELLDDVQVYHVLLEVDGRRYDCTGEVENDGLVEFAVREYGDEAPSFWSEIAWDDPVAAKVIRWNTAWTLDVGDFLAALQPTPSPVAR